VTDKFYLVSFQFCLKCCAFNYTTFVEESLYNLLRSARYAEI